MTKTETVMTVSLTQMIPYLKNGISTVQEGVPVLSNKRSTIQEGVPVPSNGISTVREQVVDKNDHQQPLRHSERGRKSPE